MHHRQNFFVILTILAVGTAGVYAIFVHDLAAARARLAGRSKTMETTLREIFAVRSPYNFDRM